jgi:hypothetical protein
VLKTGELLVERRRGPVVPNLPLARWCSRLHLDLARLGPAPPRSSRPCASLLISALRLLAHLGPAPPRPISALRLLAHLGPAPPRSSRPCASSLVSALRLLAHLGPAPSRSSRPCASSLISALRLLAHLGPAPPRSSRPCASSAHFFDSSMVHGDVAPYFAAAAPSLLAPLARPAPPPPLAVAYPLVQHLTRRLLATRPTPRSRRLIPGDARRTYCWC